MEVGKYDRDIAVKTVALDIRYLSSLKYETIREILDTQEKQIVCQTAVHYLGAGYTKAHMTILINSVFELVKVGKYIDESKFPEICQMILDEYGHWLTFADLKLCLMTGIKGRYGTTYDRLDAQILFQWLDVYRSTRLQESERRHQEAARLARADDQGVPMPEDVRQKMEALALKLQVEPKEVIHKEFKPSLSRNLNHLKQVECPHPYHEVKNGVCERCGETLL